MIKKTTFIVGKLFVRIRNDNTTIPVKGGFFSESDIRFFKSPNLPKKTIPKNYPENDLNKLFIVMDGNFKFQAQDSFFGISFFGRLEKRISLSE